MDFQAEVEHLSSVRKRLLVEIPAEVASGEYERIAKEYSGKVRLPGFRPGRAPVGLVKRHFREEIRGDVLNKLIPRTYDEALEKHSLKPLGQPALNQVSFESDQPLKYVAEFEVLPEFELPDYKGLDVELEATSVTEEDVERELTRLQERNSILEPVEDRGVQNGDYVLVDLKGDYLWDGEPPADPPEPIQEENLTVHVGAENTHQAFTEALGGMNVAEEKELDVDYGADYPDEKLAGNKVHFTLHVNDIKRRVLPDLTDEFAKDLGDYENLEQLRSSLHSQLEEKLEHERKDTLYNKLLEKLVSAADFEVPESLIEEAVDERIRRFARRISSQGVNPLSAEIDWKRFRDEVRPAAVEQVKSDLILERISDAESIQVGKEERDEEIRKLAESMGVDPAPLRQSLIQDGRLEGLLEHIRRRKTLDWLAENAKVSEGRGKKSGKKKKESD